jgi:hypothetical protein
MIPHIFCVIRAGQVDQPKKRKKTTTTTTANTANTTMQNTT